MNIIKLARQARNGKVHDPLEVHMFYKDELERFAALVREECAKKCESFARAEYATGKVDYDEQAWTDYCAAAIRRMGNE